MSGMRSRGWRMVRGGKSLRHSRLHGGPVHCRLVQKPADDPDLHVAKRAEGRPPRRQEEGIEFDDTSIGEPGPRQQKRCDAQTGARARPGEIEPPDGSWLRRKTWMRGTSPRMTERFNLHGTCSRWAPLKEQMNLQMTPSRRLRGRPLEGRLAATKGLPKRQLAHVPAKWTRFADQGHAPPSESRAHPVSGS
jgi:hypothetical protein